MKIFYRLQTYIIIIDLQRLIFTEHVKLIIFDKISAFEKILAIINKKPESSE